MEIVVLGFGKSGKGAVELLSKDENNIIDVYTDKLLCNDIKQYKNIHFVNSINKKYDLAVISPGFTKDNLAVKSLNALGVKIISEIELGYRYTKNIIAVTGTNGKSTTCKLIENMLKSAGIEAVVCGNFGYSFCRAVAENENRTFVVETSSFQLENICEYKPKAIVITNISKDHLDRYSTFEEYKLTKKRILKNYQNEILVANFDDKNVRELVEKFSSKVGYFSMRKDTNLVYLKDDIIYCNLNGVVPLLKTSDLYIDYPFEIENCLAVIALGIKLNIPLVNIIDTVKYFDGLKYRLEYVKEYKGKKYYNNSKCTNVASCIESIKAVKEDCLLILGGSSKNENFEDLFDNLPKNVKRVAICGENAKSIIKNAKQYSKICKIYNSIEEILEESKKYNDVKVVLYSPSSASFDKYTCSEQRGETFCNLVKNIK